MSQQKSWDCPQCGKKNIHKKGVYLPGRDHKVCVPCSRPILAKMNEADAGWTDEEMTRLAEITPEDLVAASDLWDQHAPTELKGVLGDEKDRTQK